MYEEDEKIYHEIKGTLLWLTTRPRLMALINVRNFISSDKFDVQLNIIAFFLFN